MRERRVSYSSKDDRPYSWPFVFVLIGAIGLAALLPRGPAAFSVFTIKVPVTVIYGERAQGKRSAAKSDGLASQNEPPEIPCEGDGFRVPLIAPLSGLSVPGSSLFKGPGNVKEPRRCPKHRVRERGGCEHREQMQKETANK